MKALFVTRELKYHSNDGKEKIYFKPGLPYLFTESYALQFQEMLKKYENFHIKPCHVCDWRNDFPLYRFNESKRVNKVIIMRNGGIGDLFGYSAIVKYLQDFRNLNCAIRTVDKFQTLGKWFYKDVEFQRYTDPAKIFNFQIIRALPIEGNIISADQHWYKMWFEQMKEPFSPEYGRPFLKIAKKSQNIDEKDKVILINPRTSKQMKSIPFVYLYNAVRKVYPANPVYAHISNLRGFDLKVFDEKKDNKLQFIYAKTIDDFLADCAAAWLTVSTDTAIIHFREGIQRPGIAVFNCFPAKSHTEFYKYTHSFDIKSRCPHQPCFYHDLNHSYCVMCEGKKVAVGPCYLTKLNGTAVDQIAENINNYKF